MPGLGQALPGLHHQPFKRGIAIALAQAQRAGHFDEEHAAAVAVGKCGVELLQHVMARRQAGFRIAGGRCAAGTRQGRRLGACAADAVGHRGDQVAGPDRLAQVIVGAAVEYLELALRIRITAEEHDRQQLQAGLLADQCGQPHAIQPGQVQIHQDQVGAVFLIACSAPSASLCTIACMPAPCSTLCANRACARSSSTISTR